MGAELNSHNFLSAVAFLVYPLDSCSEMAETGETIIKISRLVCWSRNCDRLKIGWSDKKLPIKILF